MPNILLTEQSWNNTLWRLPKVIFIAIKKGGTVLVFCLLTGLEECDNHDNQKEPRPRIGYLASHDRLRSSGLPGTRTLDKTLSQMCAG